MSELEMARWFVAFGLGGGFVCAALIFVFGWIPNKLRENRKPWVRASDDE